MWLSRAYRCSLGAVLRAQSGAITCCHWPLLCTAPRIAPPFISGVYLWLLAMEINGVRMKHPKGRSLLLC